MPYLSRVFGLTTFEDKCVVISLAVELDRKYEKLYAFLNDDVTCKDPTIDLAMKLLCATPEEKLSARMSFTPRSNLCRYILKEDESTGAGSALLLKALRLDERIMRFLLNSEQIDDGIRSFTEVFLPVEELTPLLSGQEVQDKIRAFMASNSIIFYFHGPCGTGKKLQVKHYCKYFSLPLLIVDLRVAGGQEQPFKKIIEKVIREAILHQAVLCFDNYQFLFENESSRRNIGELFEALKVFSGLIFLLADSFKKPVEFNNGYYFIDIEFNIPKDFERKRFWEYFSKGHSFWKEIDWGAIAGKFCFTPGQIRNALMTAKNMADWYSGASGQIKIEELYKACYAQVRHNLGDKASRVQSRYGWDDIVLPPEQIKQLQNACNQVKYRHIVYGKWGFEEKLSYGKGLCVLFSGPPGTGKTMSAQVMAKELYLELYKIDLSQVVSKYIGETEKNLQQIFQEAQLSNAILFFDETDALFGKRSEVRDSHDRYANIETAYLLQKIEEYEGVTILATNFIQNIDEAFMRRFNFIIEFPFPDKQYREKIWKSIFPEEAPLSDDIDFEFIASKFEVAGGNIKNIAVSSAFLAADASEPIGMKHIVAAAKYELNKIGKLLLKEDLGEYNNIINI
ncbi:MAG: ATP-dependent zinc metalloprotease FtsH [Pelotomaculum sp. PtaB.Bin104]|nr:MAG: ATP-dependent zinc metalloprotease FtsH [Pelotomaculum sp. PtaB.Bin104]